jgi:release factor glutamine methyltransferase
MIAAADSYPTIQACLQSTERLRVVSDSSRLDIELLLCKVLACSRAFLYGWPEQELSLEQQKTFSDLLGKRQAGHPIAHLIGEREFWSLSLRTNNSTLIPRPDTELLVEAVLQLDLPNRVRLLDLGTGTGAIALALAHEKTQWHVSAVDQSAAAVELAKLNASSLDITNVVVRQSDWFDVFTAAQLFEVIVSNPPYIDVNDPHLQRGDVSFEPASALVAGQNGLADLFHIIESSRQFLSVDGWLVLEHGFTQALAVRQKMQESGYVAVTTRVDYGGNDRITLGMYRAGVDI